LAIAQATDAEIISMDSMAIYRDMDIGTAKPTAEQRERVPHHQIDIVDPNETYSVSNYVSATHRIASEIHARGKNVLICGGTPLYLKSLLRGLFLGPEADWEFREAIESEVKSSGIDVLRNRLRQVDPLSAHRIHPNDSRRMIRALEAARVTGKPLSHWQEQFEVPAKTEDCPSLVLKLDRAWLHQLINARVDRMLNDGLQQEVELLLEKYGSFSRTAAQAVGYREILAQRETGASVEETIELIRAHTRQFARRQEIWFRGLTELNALPMSQEYEQDALVEQAIAFYRQYPQG
jgi:tRNA dimethylallyltransferase